MVVSCCQFDLLVLFSPLPSLLILRVTFYPLEKCSTDEGYMLSDSIVQDLGPMLWAHAVPKEMGVVQVA